MNTRILLLALSVVAFSSCSVYRSGQTPDDVYYSPAKVQAQGRADDNGNDYVDVRQPKQGTNYQTYEQYQDSYRDDRFLRMSIGNPYYLNSYNSYSGFDWRYNSFYDGFNFGFTSPWNNYFAWNSYYNPYSYYGSYGGGYYGGHYSGGYYGGGTVTYSTPARISRPVAFNVNSYSNGRPASANRSYLNSYNNGQRYNNGNNNNSGNRTSSYYNNSGSNNRNSYTPSNSNSSNSNSNNYTPTRSYTPSSSSSSSSGSSGGSSGGGGGGSVSRPSRGN